MFPSWQRPHYILLDIEVIIKEISSLAMCMILDVLVGVDAGVLVLGGDTNGGRMGH